MQAGDGARILTASIDGAARVWDAATARQIAIFGNQHGAIWDASNRTDGTRVLTVSSGSTAATAASATQTDALLASLVAQDRSPLRQADFEAVARRLGTQWQTIAAAAEVEGGPLGAFGADGRPIIVFERQLEAFEAIVKANNLQIYLQRRDWVGFARGYNGASEAANQYDTKMAAAYARLMGQRAAAPASPSTTRSMRPPIPQSASPRL